MAFTGSLLKENPTMKIKLIMLVSLFAFGFAFNANAGAVVDGDSDLVPDAFDNCVALPNGPAQGSNQVDADLDGYGNACDADYNNDPNFAVNTLDFSIFLTAFTGGPTTVTDADGDGDTTTIDFSTFLAAFQLGETVPQIGPSGLACAGVTVPCVP
jgi:hypothetical protein